jgi:hypothetical protein
VPKYGSAVPWTIAILRILRRDNDEILGVTVEKSSDGRTNQTLRGMEASRPGYEQKQVLGAAELDVQVLMIPLVNEFCCIINVM